MADCKARIGSETTRCGHTLSVGTHCGAVQSVALMTQSVTHIHRWSIPRQPLAVQTRKQAISSSRWTGIHDVYGTGDRWAGGWRPQWASLARCKHGSPCHSLPESTVTLRIVTSTLCAIEIHLLTYLDSKSHHFLLLLTVHTVLPVIINLLITDRVSTGGYAVASVRPFRVQLLNWVTFDLLHVYGPWP